MSETANQEVDNSAEQSRQLGSPLPAADRPLIRANELTQYNFCHRAWWLSTVQGIPSRDQAVLARGVQTHRRHGDEIRAALRWRRASFFLWGGGGLLLIMTVFYYFLL